MENRIEELLELGRMDLEAGYPEYARQYFEQVLELDPSNRKAMKGLIRVSEILSRKEAAAVEPIHGEPVKPPPKPEMQPAEQEEGSAKQKTEGLLKGGLKIGCGVAFGILIILTLCIGGLIAFGVLFAPEPKGMDEMIEETVREALATPTRALIPKEKTLSLHESVVVDDIKVTISEYEVLALLGEDKPPEGARFLLIHVCAENVGKVAHVLPEQDRFILVYENAGMEYCSFYNLWAPEDHQPYLPTEFRPNYPGTSEEGWICYEIPIGSDPAAMQLHVRIGSQTRVWHLMSGPSE